jgi:GntR family transcriptional regulator/MocR family aminotransferase
MFPIPTWERLQRQVLKEYQHQILEQSPPQGMERLRRAIAEYVNLERGTRARAEQVIVLTSSQQALALCSHVLMDAGMALSLKIPAIKGHKAFKSAGLHCLPVPLDEKGISIDALEFSDQSCQGYLPYAFSSVSYRGDALS